MPHQVICRQHNPFGYKIKVGTFSQDSFRKGTNVGFLPLLR
jgi:methyl coenzyme M reductase subunit D